MRAAVAQVRSKYRLLSLRLIVRPVDGSLRHAYNMCICL
jgi:hypothetical protein